MKKFHNLKIRLQIQKSSDDVDEVAQWVSGEHMQLFHEKNGAKRGLAEQRWFWRTGNIRNENNVNVSNISKGHK